MVPGSNFKRVWITYPGAVKDNDDFVGTQDDASPVIVDTAGFNYAVVHLVIGFTDVTLSSFIIESDDSSTMASPTARYTFGATGKIALPTGDSDNTSYSVGIDLNAAPERYWGVTSKAGNGTVGTYAAIWIDLYRGDEMPISATQRGITAIDFI